ncbi:hypothetical protein QC762_107490 [Podospora pseudocomata]|uniref:N-acetylglucosamine-induced protein 1 n=1 Tax=Podospora pseudocomata TaxID=2093779 RepID=A0ABR0GTQ1_9PEZI|nr:hypothetical protein QC762_107490 [Podospora pseudocomata]
MGSTSDDPPMTSTTNTTNGDATTSSPNGTNSSEEQSRKDEEDIPYWNVNVPPHLRTQTCPSYLLNLNPKDLSIISTPDSHYEIESWPTVLSKIRSYRPDLFQRIPSDLRRYHEFCYNIKQQYGSVMNFILSQRLGWEHPIIPKGDEPFECEEDVKILRNDWPYGIDGKIVHLVVWVKFELEAEGEKGDLTEKETKVVGEWVRKKFVVEGGLEEGRVVWFRNWTCLKSVKSVEHFHVMLFDPDKELVDGLTGGDVPLCQRVKLSI